MFSLLFFLLLKHNTADPNGPSLRGTPKSRSLSEDRQEFHLHATGVEPSTICGRRVPEGGYTSEPHPWDLISSLSTYLLPRICWPISCDAAKSFTVVNFFSPLPLQEARRKQSYVLFCYQRLRFVLCRTGLPGRYCTHQYLACVIFWHTERCRRLCVVSFVSPLVAKRMCKLAGQMVSWWIVVAMAMAVFKHDGVDGVFTEPCSSTSSNCNALVRLRSLSLTEVYSCR